ncbi:MAG: carbonic anhydrase [Planctomycetota bacterium]|nr:carbonic anhydrase [Planctomycetota bacterium]
MIGIQNLNGAGIAKLRKRRPEVEGLEDRLALSALGVTTPAAHVHIAGSEHAKATLGTITGQITKDSTGKGIRGVQVQLIDSSGNVAQKTVTNGSGHYTFKIKANGSYVVREVTPRHFTQASTTFATTAPTGALVNGAGNNSWNYSTGNSDPAFGPVGPASWATIAPAGTLAFESPINITGPPIDLSKVLTVNYANAVPTQEINNSHQIQVQFAPTTGDTITVGGQQSTLAQFHYHDPSENAVNGHIFSMEEHFVNLSASGAETVVAVFLQLGAHNAALDPVLNAATANLTTPNSTTPGTTAINFAGLLPASTLGYFYQGSLTTPPLSQPVNWFVYSTPITLDHQQLQQYEKVAAGSGFLPNARPLQSLDGRLVNESDYDVNFQNQSVAGLNFTVARTAQAKAKHA